MSEPEKKPEWTGWGSVTGWLWQDINGTLISLARLYDMEVIDSVKTKGFFRQSICWKATAPSNERIEFFRNALSRHKLI
jgi:hypothetical protein